MKVEESIFSFIVFEQESAALIFLNRPNVLLTVR
jgi:hypothetical protein